MQRTDELLAQILNGIEANNVASNNMQSYLKEIARSSQRQGGSGGNSGVVMVVDDHRVVTETVMLVDVAGMKKIRVCLTRCLKHYSHLVEPAGTHNCIRGYLMNHLLSWQECNESWCSIVGYNPVTKMFAALVTSGMALYEFMNESYKMYTDLNSAGVTMSDSMFSIKASASQAWISMDEFGSVMKSNTSVLTAMQAEGGNAVDRFASLSNTVLNLQSTMGEYGLQNKQIVGLTAQYIKYQNCQD